MDPETVAFDVTHNEIRLLDELAKLEMLFLVYQRVENSDFTTAEKTAKIYNYFETFSQLDAALDSMTFVVDDMAKAEKSEPGEAVLVIIRQDIAQWFLHMVAGALKKALPAPLNDLYVQVGADLYGKLHGALGLPEELEDAAPSSAKIPAINQLGIVGSC